MNKCLSLGMLVATVAFASIEPALAAEPIKLRFSQLTPRTHFYHKDILLPWQREVQQATEGRVVVEFTTAPLGPMPRNFDMARQGVADITGGNHGVTPGRFLVVQIVQTPTLKVDSPESVSVALWRTHEKFLKKANEHKGTHLLSLHVSGSAHFFTTSKPITKREDFKGLKLLAVNTKAVRILKNLDAVPILKPVTEYYEAISKGTVDGVVTTNTAVKGWKVEPFVKHQLSMPGGFLYSTFFLVMNQRKWDSIPEGDQKAIMRVSGEAYAKRAGQVFEREDKSALADRKKRGIEPRVISDPKLLESVKQAAAFIDEEWIKVADKAGIDGEAALKYFKDEAESYK